MIQEVLILEFCFIFLIQMELNKQQTKQIYPGIKIRKKLAQIDQQLTYLFYLDVQDLKTIDFETDFTGSENINIKNKSSHQRIVQKTVQPRQVTLVAQVQLHQGWKLKTTFRFRRRPIPKDKQLQYINPQLSNLASEKLLVETVLKKIDVNLTPLDDLDKILEKSKVKFIDCQFPPQQTSIVGQSDKNLIDDTVNHWRRPSEIYDGNYHLIDRLNHNHLERGKLKDNSFYSVLACLTLSHHSLLERLFFNIKNVNSNGIYRLRLCKNGEWQTVTIDDMIPCEPLGQPKFISTTSNEIWPSLIQKAYAKLHKRYLNLHELQVAHVFSDLTGCPTYIEDIQSTQIQKTIIQNYKNKNIVTFYDIQEKEFEEEQFMPLKQYAYPLLGFEKEEGVNCYVILSHSHQKILLTETELIKKFRYVCICHAKNWEQVRLKGKFMTADAGTQQDQYPISMSRWHYSLDLPQNSDVHISLHQEDILIGNNNLFKPYIYCSLLLLEKSQKSFLKPIICKQFSHNREIQLKISLQAGIYLIIPFINSESSIKKAPSEQDQIVDIFKKLDLLMRRQLKFSELVPFFKVCNQVFDEEIFEGLLKNYSKGRKGIGMNAFREMWSKNRIYWKDCLEYYERQRIFTISIHSTVEINILIKNNIGTQFNNKSHCQLIGKLGKDLVLSNKAFQKYAKVKFFVSKCNIVEYMIQNKHERKIQITLDCSDSKGYYYVPRSGKISLVLDSGQKQFVLKMIPFEKCEPKDLIKNQKFLVKTFD